MGIRLLHDLNDLAFTIMILLEGFIYIIVVISSLNVNRVFQDIKNLKFYIKVNNILVHVIFVYLNLSFKMNIL